MQRKGGHGLARVKQEQNKMEGHYFLPVYTLTKVVSGMLLQSCHPAIILFMSSLPEAKSKVFDASASFPA